MRIKEFETIEGNKFTTQDIKSVLLDFPDLTNQLIREITEEFISNGQAMDLTFIKTLLNICLKQEDYDEITKGLMKLLKKSLNEYV